MTVSNQDQGFQTANFTPTTSPSQTSPTASTVSVDTGNTGGATPATVSVPLGLLTQSNLVAPAITAHAGGGKTSATQLTYGISNITVCATAANSVKLPPAVAGAWCFLRNVTATSMTVFGGGTDVIDGVATGTGNPQAGTKGEIYFGVVGTGDGVAGSWVTLLGA